MVLTDLLLSGSTLKNKQIAGLVNRVRHYMQQRQTKFETGLKTVLGSPLQMQWRCTQKTLGCLCSHFQLFVPSSSFIARATHCLAFTIQKHHRLHLYLSQGAKYYACDCIHDIRERKV